MEISRDFIHGKKIDEQWKALGLDDNDLKELQRILVENPKVGVVCRVRDACEKCSMRIEIAENLIRFACVMWILNYIEKSFSLWYLPRRYSICQERHGKPVASRT